MTVRGSYEKWCSNGWINDKNRGTYMQLSKMVLCGGTKKAAHFNKLYYDYKQWVVYVCVCVFIVVKQIHTQKLTRTFLIHLAQHLQQFCHSSGLAFLKQCSAAEDVVYVLNSIKKTESIVKFSVS